MTFNYNHVTLVGRATNIPEIKKEKDALKSSFRLAIDRPYRREDGSMETDFIPIVMYGKLGEVSEKYIKKNAPILVEGRMQVVEYEVNNERKWRTEVIAENFQILESSLK